ncbi:PE family protein [Mycobacterium haemophilum]|uniref:PE domain-containing protein n=1 Tax=Mycobacterium haemophilum TaxID=29311 RepID=A0A0I9UN84_9MYCO|nr:PE family protein [Mycobacterium haemophilum]KLO30712.1 hypothetical protein ABH39_10075 [Mycobacterium haemophilum]KLO37755.1 hypothetical protein ABH38_07285 [Mycobacterium haemophilum]KLO43165.1 hypothetical protein ABH37_07800 [Mycobacterium haemophilum]KLO55577.1 hypothetical protein ABH36_06240 [Mycobacterium haemophilum]
MSFVIAVPATLAAAAGALRNIPASTAAVYAAAGPRTFVTGPGNDVVSRRVEQFFRAHAENYREISTRAEAVLVRFADRVANAENLYSIAEAANRRTFR